MANDPLTQTLADIAELLRIHNIEFALIGGLATMVRGEPRSTLRMTLGSKPVNPSAKSTFKDVSQFEAPVDITSDH